MRKSIIYGSVTGVHNLKGEISKLTQCNKNRVMAAIRAAVKRETNRIVSGQRPASTNRLSD